MNASPKKLRLVTAFLAVVVVSVVGWLVLSEREAARSQENDAENTVESPSEVAPLRVEATPAQIGDLVMRLSSTGLTRARQRITLAPKVGGQVVRLPIEDGTFVRKGALLMKLDDREVRLALSEARDKLLGAQVEYGMLVQDKAEVKAKDEAEEFVDGNSSVRSQNGQVFLKELRDRLERGEISEEAFVKAKLDYETSQVLAGERRDELMRHKSGLTAAAAAVQRAELNLSYTEIRAPFPGFVADLQVEEGEQVSAGKECFKLVDLSQMEVELQVLESEIGLVQEGRQAEVTFPAYPGESFQGRVAHINPMVDPESKTAKVTVRLINPDKRILPGMFAYAKLEAQIFQDRFLVPKEAILIRDQRKLVFIIRAGLAKWCYVETGLENEQYVEILNSTFGLKPGELVITSGHYTLVHDARVRIE